MNFIRLNNYAPIVDDSFYEEQYLQIDEEPEDDFEKLIRDTAQGVIEEEEDVKFIPEEEVERDIEDIPTSKFFLNLAEDNILYVRESNDLRNPGTIITFITGIAMYFTDRADDILMAIAEATGNAKIQEIL